MAAPELSSPGSLSFTFENDILSPQHTDRHYTNGIQITKTSRSYDQFDDSNTFGWLAKSASLLPLGKGEWLKHRTTLSLGQVMQTPEDITTSEPDPNDVPYGGILYAGHGLETFARHHADYLDIIVGITGKPALAGQAQILIHKSTGSEPPQGWDHQIPTELLLNVYYSRRHAKNLYQGHWQADWINFGRLSLGNAQTDAKVGTGFSWHQSSINPLAIRPGRLARDMVISHEGGASGWYFFTGLSAKWVAWDVLLDGTMFHDSPSVEKEQLVYEGTTHGGYKWKTWSVHYSWIISSPTFEKESGDPDHYG
ncbi:MAG: lipid A deacylase LpxR family protein, partial [Sinobacterium sp.]|nr:lipid A deacylase LpxR family protein [Sinobacterium sp.]